MVFLDGVGLGQDDAGVNPLLRARMPNLVELLDGHKPILNGRRLDARRATLIATDATLGVAGTPQSATGQTTMFTGVNAARELGYHWGPHPNPPLRQIIACHSLFKKLSAVGAGVAFANAYPERYFRDVARGKRGLSVTGLAASAAGLRLRNHEDLRDGQALSAFITNEGWRQALGYTDVPDITPRQAGRILVSLARQAHFTLFEHYYTDICGHHQDWPQAVKTLEVLDEFLGAILEELDDNMLLILSSDHGNIEDMSVRGHTLNPVPTLLVGEQRHLIVDRIASLSDLTPAVLQVIGRIHAA